MKTLQLLISLLLLSSCSYKNTKEDINKYSEQLKEDVFTYQGKYNWKFNIVGSEQISIHRFYPDSITYTMKGKIFSTDYTMKKLSYDKKINKWIGQDKEGVTYVMFFKNKTDSTLSIYKHKCKTNGLGEAINFHLPSSDATEDHGWNIYSLNGYSITDILPISGSFSNIKNQINISDSIIKFENKKIKKISYHSGERRWVGQYENKYLQIFFKSIKSKETIQISSMWSDNLEALYKTKYNSITNWNTYKKLNN